MNFIVDIIWIFFLPSFSMKWTTYQDKITNISLYAQVRNHGVMKGLVFFLACQILNGDFLIFIINKDIDLYPLCFLAISSRSLLNQNPLKCLCNSTTSNGGMNIFAWNPFTKLLTIDLLNIVLLVKLTRHEFNEFNYVECIFIMPLLCIQSRVCNILIL